MALRINTKRLPRIFPTFSSVELISNSNQLSCITMLRRNHTALAFAPEEGKLHSSVSPALARAFDGFFGPPARELRPATPPTSAHPKRKNDTALAPTPCPGVSSEMKRAFDGFFGPPAREEAIAPVTPERRSLDSLPPYEPRETQSPLPIYTVLGRY